MSERRIGVFDSGMGGLSVLQALQAELPGHDFVYVADSGHARAGGIEERLHDILTLESMLYHCRRPVHIPNDDIQGSSHRRRRGDFGPKNVPTHAIPGAGLAAAATGA